MEGAASHGGGYSAWDGAARASPWDVEMRDRDREETTSLVELESETRILLPGTQVFLAFLTMLPFTARFESLNESQRLVFITTFFATLIALVCFQAPAAYHRIARPIRHKERFKVFATALIVIGLAPTSVAFVLVTYLVCSMVAPTAAVTAAAVVAGLVSMLWWAVPLLRLHDRFTRQEKGPAGHAAE